YLDSRRPENGPGVLKDSLSDLQISSCRELPIFPPGRAYWLLPCQPQTPIFLNPFLSLRDTSRSPGLQAGKKRAEHSGPPTILWRINASTNVPRMIRIIVPASLIILPEL